MYEHFCLYDGLNTALYALPVEPGRGHQIPRDWGYRKLATTMWVLGIDPESSERGTWALNCQAISPAPSNIFSGLLVIFLVLRFCVLYIFCVLILCQIFPQTFSPILWSAFSFNYSTEAC